MKYLRTEDVPLDQIEVTDRLRPVDEGWVAGLAESMARIGQKTPVEVVIHRVVKARGPRYRLTAGAHRYAAARLLDRETIRAEIFALEQTVDFDLECLLHEIDENLIRRELSALDRAIFIGRRQEVYEELHPETKRGIAGAQKKWRGFESIEESDANDATSFASFARETAERIELSERSIQIYCRVYRLLDRQVRERLAGTPLAGNRGELYALTRHSHAHQRKIVDAVLSGKAPSVRVAAAVLDNKRTPAERSAHDLSIMRLQDAWKRAGKPARVAFMEFLTEIGVVEDFDEGQCK